MSEPAHALTPVPKAAPTPSPSEAGPKTFRGVLSGLVGKVVTVVNPESYEDAPVGKTITKGFYRGKLLAVADDHLVLATEFQHRRGDKDKEPVRQFVPLERVKRVSMMRSDRIVHL